MRVMETKESREWDTAFLKDHRERWEYFNFIQRGQGISIRNEMKGFNERLQELRGKLSS